MIKYWQALRKREQLLVMLAASVLTMAILATALTPAYESLQRLRREVPEQHRELAWMFDAAAETARLRAQGAGQQGGAPSASHLTLIEETAGRLQLAGAMKRVEPNDQEQLKVWLEGAAYDRLVDWLYLLADQGLRVVSLSMDHLESLGQVNARVTFAGAK